MISGHDFKDWGFLGDLVLDFLITRHFLKSSEAWGREPGLLTDLRSAAVSNECFAVRHNPHTYRLLHHYYRELAGCVEKYRQVLSDLVKSFQLQERLFWTLTIV